MSVDQLQNLTDELRTYLKRQPDCRVVIPSNFSKFLSVRLI